MAVEDRSLSEFPRALQVAEQALVMISNPDGLGGYDTNGAVLTEVGKALLNVQYTQQLGNVSVFDAIKNTRVLSGTTTPTANEGANGQLYVKYQTVSNVDTVIGMYFKKDGTWLEISLGGGGGSSTLAGLSDVDITTPTGGQALVYDDVNDEWVNGDVSQVIVYPIAVTSQMVTASSTVGSNFEGYRAFDGQSCNLSTLQGGWLAGSGDNTPTLTVNFGEAKKLGRISIETANNNNPDTTRDIYIEGSSDGSTWENILASGSTVSLVFEVGKYNEYSFNLNEGEYQYFRIRGTQPFFGGSFQYACSFSEITVYDTSSGIPAIADLTDVDITSPTDGQLLRYNGTSGKWENAGIINDTTASASSVYSSNKVNTLLSGKADKVVVVTGVTKNSNIIGDAEITVLRIDKVVFVKAHLKAKAQITTSDQILLSGLPARSGYRNANTFPCAIGNEYLNTDSELKGVWIDGSGNLNLSSTTTINSDRAIILDFWYYTV